MADASVCYQGTGLLQGLCRRGPVAGDAIWGDPNESTLPQPSPQGYVPPPCGRLGLSLAMGHPRRYQPGARAA